MFKFHKHTFVFIALIWLCSLNRLMAQKVKPADFGIKSKKALELYMQGQQNDQWRDRKTAINFYLQATAIEPEFGMAWYAAAEDNYLLQNYKAGLVCIENAFKFYKPPPPVLTFFLAEFNFYNLNYDRAAKFYQAFLDAKPPVTKKIADEAVFNLRNSIFAAAEIKKPVKFELKNLGPGVNTIGEEYLPNLTADDQIIFFTTRRPGCTGDYMAEMRGYGEDFYFSNLGKENQWMDAINLGPPVNTSLNEGAASFSPDGQVVYYTGCNRKDGLGSCDLYEAKLEGDKWTQPRNLGPEVNSEYWESQPCISSDGRMLFFVSSRPGGQGGNDIWYSKKVNGKWSKAVNLGTPVNTPGNEYSPFLHADGISFYFSSDQHPGFGSIDLFLSRKKGDTWTAPVNLGYPVNSPLEEQTIFVNTNGTKGYVSSVREGGLGGWDIYEFPMDEKIKPFVATFVRGIVRDSATRKPVEANITFIDIETRDTIRTLNSNKISGKYLLNLPLEREYAAFTDAKGYLFQSQNFSLKGLSKGKEMYFDLDIYLSPIREGATIVLRNIFYETAKFNLLSASEAELDHIVNFLRQNPRVKIEISGHTDDIGTDLENKTLSENRAGEVKKYLTAKGILGERVETRGYGESKPMAPNDTEENRALNRRTEFRILGM